MTVRIIAVCHASKADIKVLTSDTLSFLVGNGTYVCSLFAFSSGLMHTLRLDRYSNPYAHRSYHPTPDG